MKKEIAVFEDFKDALAASGLKAGRIIGDGEIHRVPVDGDKPGSTSGAYALHLDGRPAGFIQNFKTGNKKNWRFDGELSPAVKASLKHAPKAAEIDREAQAAQAARVAYGIWQNAKPAPADHPYLVAKKVEPKGVKLDQKGNLIVPFFGVDGKLKTLQFIGEDGKKRFLTNGRVSGATFQLGQRRSYESVFVAEGFATAASLHQATGKPVVCVGGAGNFDKAIAALKKNQYSRFVVILAPDNDERGQKAAKEISEKYQIKTIIPPKEKNIKDWNDYFCRHGKQKTLNTTRTQYQQIVKTLECSFEIGAR